MVYIPKSGAGSVLLLLTVLLVVAGLVLLIVGYVGDTLLLIWLGTLCAAVAGVVLIVFSRLSRRRALRMPIDVAPVAPMAPTMLVGPNAPPVPRPVVTEAPDTLVDDDQRTAEWRDVVGAVVENLRAPPAPPGETPTRNPSASPMGVAQNPDDPDDPDDPADPEDPD